MSKLNSDTGRAATGPVIAPPYNRGAIFRENGPFLPSPQSCLRLVRALAVETHKEWLDSPRYLNMDDLREHKKQQMRVAA
jgi:transposase-like protein